MFSSPHTISDPLVSYELATAPASPLEGLSLRKCWPEGLIFVRSASVVIWKIRIPGSEAKIPWETWFVCGQLGKGLAGSMPGWKVCSGYLKECFPKLWTLAIIYYPHKSLLSMLDQRLWGQVWDCCRRVRSPGGLSVSGRNSFEIHHRLENIPAFSTTSLQYASLYKPYSSVYQTHGLAPIPNPQRRLSGGEDSQYSLQRLNRKTWCLFAGENPWFHCATVVGQPNHAFSFATYDQTYTWPPGSGKYQQGSVDCGKIGQSVSLTSCYDGRTRQAYTYKHSWMMIMDSRMGLEYD